MTPTRESPPAREPRGQEITDARSEAIVAQTTDLAVYRACRAAYQHLRARGLVSEVVVAELRRLVREAAT